jgi:hypothetical protein
VKNLLVRYRRWALTLIVLLLPIISNILSNVISRSQNASGIYKMGVNGLNPQTILYQADPSMGAYFRAAIGSKSSNLVLEKQSGNISDMNEYIQGTVLLNSEQSILTYRSLVF